MDSLLHDLRYGARLLARNPVFTTVAIVTLALGIGASTAVFTVVNAVLLRPLPYPDPERLVGMAGASVSAENLAHWNRLTGVFDAFAMVNPWPTYTLSGVDQPERVNAAQVSAEFFSLLGVQPALGRTFLPEEDRPGGEPVALISQGLWERQFSSDTNVVGQRLTLDQQNFTVVGVLPSHFQFPGFGRTDVWLPVKQDPRVAQAVARLRRGLTLEQATSRLRPLAEAVRPEKAPAWMPSLHLNSVSESAVVRHRTLLLLLLGAVGLVLLIASANIANLLLARAKHREKEIALRAALGAGRARLTRTFLTESALLFFLGGIAGLLLSRWGTQVLLALYPIRLPGMQVLAVDGTVLGFSLLATFIPAVLFGLIPAMAASRPDVNQVLKQGSASLTAAPAHRRVGGALAVVEIALSVVLVVGTGLLVRTFLKLLPTAPGFDPARKLTFRIELPEYRYPVVARQQPFFEELLARLQQMPGAEDAAAVSHLRFTSTIEPVLVSVEGGMSSVEKDMGTHPFYRVCTPNYFRVMGMAIVEGRGFTAADQPGTAPVAVVNQTMARRFWVGRDSVGDRLAVKTRQGWVEHMVVGIVADARANPSYTAAHSEIFVPLKQTPRPGLTVVVQTNGEPRQFAPAARQVVRGLDGDLPVTQIRSLEQILDASVSLYRSRAWLTGIFTGLALLLALVGVYGVIAYSVAQRVREVGIRMALGAQRGDILRLILRQGVILALLGVGGGILASLGLTRFLQSMVREVSPTDPVTYATVPLLIFLAVLLASYVPARRATQVDPLVALRYE